MREFIYKQIKASSMGVVVEKLPPIILPPMNDKTTQVPGRHGMLHETDGRYGEILHSIECWVKDDASIPGIATWLSGGGWLQLDTLPGRAYKARMVNQIDFTRVLSAFNTRRFTAVFKCYPLKYYYPAPENIIVSSSGTQINNPGTAESEPVITVNGSGDISLMVGQYVVSLSGVSGSITLDSELKEAYKGMALANAQMAGEFPELLPGLNAVTWLGSVSSVVITPNWRDI